MKNNAFSKHDNRHSIENCGIYLQEGFGKKLAGPHKNQHRSDSQLFAHEEVNQQKFISTYASGYLGNEQRCSSVTEDSTYPTTKGKWPLNVYSTGSTKNTFRRFPQRYSLPKDKESARPSANTIWWYGSSPKSGSTHPTSNLSSEQETKGGDENRCQTLLRHGARPPDHMHNVLEWKTDSGI